MYFSPSCFLSPPCFLSSSKVTLPLSPSLPLPFLSLSLSLSHSSLLFAPVATPPPNPATTLQPLSTPFPKTPATTRTLPTIETAYAPKMVAPAFQLTSLVPPPPATLNFSTLSRTSVALVNPSLFKTKSRPTAAAALRRTKKTEEQDLHGLPKEFYDDEWQAQQREKTKKLHQQRQVEDEEEERKVDEYREIGMRLKDYPEDDLRQARQLVSSLLKSAEEVEEKIEEAAERGELTELVLMVIWNRLDLARRDDEKDAIRSLDLLYRRIETEILKREAPPAMRLLNDLLILHDGFDEEGWLKECRKRMVETFPREDPYSILVPVGFDIDKHQGPLRPPLEEEDDILLRVDFVREVDALLREVRAEQREAQNFQGLDPESVAIRLKQQEKQQTIRLVEALLDLAIDLKW